MQTLIANPAAGRGYGAQAAKELSGELTARGVQHELLLTQYKDHARDLAATAAADGASAVWVLGGESTLREAATGLYGTGVPMGPIPCGTGNDLCRALGIPARAPVAAYDAQQGGIRRIDLWRINDLFFINVAGIGFDTETLVHTQTFRWLPGSMLPYMLGALTTIITHKNVRLRLSIDAERFDERLLLLSIANGQFIGGGMRVAPDAVLDDGLLDVILIRPVAKPRIPFLLPKFLKGSHIDLPVTTVVRAQEIHIQCDEALIFQADGDLFPATDIRISKAEHGLLLCDGKTTRASGGPLS